MNFDKILLAGEKDDTDKEDDSGGEGKGIYSIKVKSHNGRFVKCFTVEVERSPTSVYNPPAGYRMVSTATTLSTGGIHIKEVYVPQVLLDMDIQILLLSASVNPTSGAASGVEHKALTSTERNDLYKGLGDVAETFKKLLKVIDKTIPITSNLTTTKCLKEFSFGYDNVRLQEIDGLLSKRITPSSFMQIIYAGFEVILVQKDLNAWELTDMYTLIGESDEKIIEVSLDQLSSMSSSYNYKKMAKYSNVMMTAEGVVGFSKAIGGNDSISDIESQKIYADKKFNVALPSRSRSVATGADVEMASPALPMLRVSRLKGVVVVPSTGDKPAYSKWTSTGDCFGGKTIEAVAVKAKPSKSGFQTDTLAKDSDARYDISALGVKVKGLFAKHIHSMLAFKNKMESEDMTMSLEGVTIGAFTTFSTPSGGSLQKVVISATEVKKEVESADTAVTGFIMNSTTVRAAGRTVSYISYVNMKDTFPLVFGSSKK